MYMTQPNINVQYPEERLASDESLAQLSQFIANASRIAVFTGAGISTESGIPDYRGPDGVWARNAIPHIDNLPQGDQARLDMWSFRRERYPEMLARQPNRGHLAIVELERRGKLLAVITQNIDGLHQKAGNHPDRIIELHGSTHHLRCLNCGTVFDGEEIQARLDAGENDPRCTVCGGPLRTATVLFGESLPEDALRKAVLVSRACDLMLVVGSSLVVNPAARLPQLAKDSGSKVVIVNREPTPLDAIADLRILADAGSTLSGAIALLSEAPELDPE
jgi:NAD-dependent deacetylase